MRNTFLKSAWGNFPTILGKVINVSNRAQLKKVIIANETIIPHGNARSYGDSALNDKMIQYNESKKTIEFDFKTGIANLCASTQIGDLINHILSLGWFPSVVPGTKFVTIGGAIAGDIHGKNHHVNGSFSQYVISFRLMLSNGEIITCSCRENTELFKATCGGMGLTGVILNAKIQTIKVQSRFIEQTSYKAKNIEELFSHFAQHDSKRYSVAWIDCTAKGIQLGRGILMTGDFAIDGDLQEKTSGVHSRLKIPFFLPSWIINPISLKIFNTLYYHLTSVNDRKKVAVDFNTFFFPLDQILHWNRLYGKQGFLQYQFVLPLEHSAVGIKKILNHISDSGQGSPLAVLKLFGPENDNYLSFPMEGFTLALDFKNQPSLFPLLDKLDTIVNMYNGRIYLAKDSRVKEPVFKQGYKHIDKFLQLRQQYKLANKFKSNQSIRLGL
jgi:decaprenylphospho-beta-D-ribofuranose 2-oxidase